MTKEDDKQWHLSRNVPISLIAAIFVQSLAIVWWASATESRVAQLEKALVRVDIEVTKDRADISSVQKSVVRIETQLDGVLVGIRQIQNRLNGAGK